MRIRPGEVADLDNLIDLDATIESSHYLHVERSGGEAGSVKPVAADDAGAPDDAPVPLAVGFQLDERPLREKLLDRNAVGDDVRFTFRQLLGGIEDGIVLAAEHGGALTGLIAARHDAARNVLELVDLRVDYETRRQGLGSAMLYQVIAHARQIGARAVTAVTRTNNVPAARFMLKSGFDLSGLDTRRESNHDLVKESVSLLWYAALD